MTISILQVGRTSDLGIITEACFWERGYCWPNHRKSRGRTDVFWIMSLLSGIWLRKPEQLLYQWELFSKNWQWDLKNRELIHVIQQESIAFCYLVKNIEISQILAQSPTGCVNFDSHFLSIAFLICKRDSLMLMKPLLVLSLRNSIKST